MYIIWACLLKVRGFLSMPSWKLELAEQRVAKPSLISYDNATCLRCIDTDFQTKQLVYTSEGLIFQSTFNNLTVRS